MSTTHISGPVTVEHTQNDETFVSSKYEHIAQVSRLIPEYESNAEFIADAFNVAHETGKTPRQLAEEHREMLEALKALYSMEHTQGVTDEQEAEIFSQVERAIAKAEGRG